MTTEVIEGTAIEVEPDEPRALSVIEPAPRQGHLAVGVGALASMSDDEFSRNLAMLEKGVERAAAIKRAIMVESEDFGLIPGTNKPSLLKPGAEKLALAYGLTGSFAHDIKYGDGETTPPITVVVDSYLHLGGADGPVVAQGMGMASSWEKRYRWRKGGRVCPDCQRPGILMTKRNQWWHPNDAKPDGGCGANFEANDKRVTEQEVGDIENPDPYELGNTLLKMAEKRAYVDAVLRATASSGLFTQDMEADEGDGHPGSGNGGQRPPGQHSTPPPRQELTRSTGIGGLIGKVALGKGQDFQLRQTPDDTFALSFRLKEGNKAGQIVAAEGSLALELEAIRDTLIGQTATVWGTFSPESYDKVDKDDPRKVETIAYTVLHAERVQTPDFMLPASPDVAAAVFPDDDLSDLPF
jgi:hypothetical protein